MTDENFRVIHFIFSLYIRFDFFRHWPFFLDQSGSIL